MSTLLEEPLRGEPQRRRSQPLILVLRRQENVEVGVAVVGLGLFAVAEPPRERAVDLDRKRGPVVDETLPRVLDIVQRPPPLPDAGARQNRGELVDLTLSQRSQRNASGTQSRKHRASVPLAGIQAARLRPNTIPRQIGNESQRDRACAIPDAPHAALPRRSRCTGKHGHHPRQPRHDDLPGRGRHGTIHRPPRATPPRLGARIRPQATPVTEPCFMAQPFATKPRPHTHSGDGSRTLKTE